MLSATPSPQALASANGLAQMLVSLIRAIGPAGATSLFAWSVEYSIAGGYLVFIVYIAIAVFTLFCGSLLPREEKRYSGQGR